MKVDINAVEDHLKLLADVSQREKQEKLAEGKKIQCFVNA